MRVAGVLLAAGAGSRLGRPKALVELGGMRLVDRGIALLRAGGTAPVVAVTGAAVVELLGVITVHNPDWRSGMGSSLAVGLGSVPINADAAVIALVDQPLVGPGSVRRLIAAYRAGARVAVGPTTAGRVTRSCSPGSTGQRPSLWPSATSGLGRSCAPIRTS